MNGEELAEWLSTDVSPKQKIEAMEEELARIDQLIAKAKAASAPLMHKDDED